MSKPDAAAEVFVGGGEMGVLMRSIDWARTAIGPVERWPQSLRTALSIVLASRHPLLICWGSQFVQLYNDAYSPILGGKHPHAMGRAARETWAGRWSAEPRTWSARRAASAWGSSSWTSWCVPMEAPSPWLSTEARGTTFTVCLPRHVPAWRERSPEELPAPP